MVHIALEDETPLGVKAFEVLLVKIPALVLSECPFGDSNL
jgi:hypothetical protein